MLRQGRIWDFKDIFIGAVYYYGEKEACDKIFGSFGGSETPLKRILLDWSTAIYDESTNLALLDILVSLALMRIQSPAIVADAKCLVDQAGDLASDTVQYHPNGLKSRQYIRWILAKVAVNNYQDILSSSQLSDLPGVFLTDIPVMGLPIYISAAFETPDWNLLCRPPKSSKTLQMALEVARQLGDLETEALCLSQLVAHSADPAELFDELINLQKTVQKDIQQLLRTCLSKYPICRDKQTRDALREELLLVSDDAILHPDLVWAKKMILRALAHSPQEANLWLNEAKQPQYGLSSLSENIVDFMERNKLVKADVKPPLETGENGSAKKRSRNSSAGNAPFEAEVTVTCANLKEPEPKVSNPRSKHCHF